MNEEKFLFIFFVVTLIIMISLLISKFNVLDILYLLVVTYYFIKFIFIKSY